MKRLLGPLVTFVVYAVVLAIEATSFKFVSAYTDINVAQQEIKKNNFWLLKSRAILL